MSDITVHLTKEVEQQLRDFYDGTEVPDMPEQARKLAFELVEKISKGTAREIQHELQKSYGV